MGYNRENYARIRSEYDRKYLLKQEEAENRKRELEAKLPGLWELDRRLASSGAEIMGAVLYATSEEDRNRRIREAKERNLALQAERAALLLQNGYPADYSDVHYDCPICGDSGFVNTKMCVCMKKSLIFAGYLSSGISTLLASSRFENFSLDYYKKNPQVYRMMEHNVRVLHDFASNFSDRFSANYLLIGGTGRGKTHLSAAVAGLVIEGGHDAYYVSAVNLFRNFEEKQFGRGAYGDGEDTRRCFEADLLIIDDLGTELTNQFTVSVLYDIIDTRISAQKSTLISTNLGENEIRKRYWDRVTSRLFGEYRPLLFEGEDVRALRVKENLKR